MVNSQPGAGQKPGQKPAQESGQERGPHRLDISQTFAKGINVLKTFDGAEADLSIAEIARRADLDRAVARRLVHTLVHLGYVRRRGRDYRLTPKVLLLASGFLQSRQFTKIVVPILNEFSREIDAPIYLAARDGYDVVYIAHAALENSAIRLGFGVGSRVPLLATSIGRALLLTASVDETSDAVDNAPLEQHTASTITDRAEIARALSRARDQGFVYSDGEFEPGVAALAMPLPASDPFPTAVGMSSDREAFSEGYQRKVVRALRSCRNQLSDTIRLL